MAGLVKEFADALKQTALVTDVGSVKESIEKESRRYSGQSALDGSHPMAGSEKSGFAAARRPFCRCQNHSYLYAPNLA